MNLSRLTSSTKILIGLVSGVIVGLFFGEYAGVLKLVADGFVNLLQMTVLPYITLSIITSLGTLSFDQVCSTNPSRASLNSSLLHQSTIAVHCKFLLKLLDVSAGESSISTGAELGIKVSCA